MTVAPAAPVVINGWSIFVHPLFLDQIDQLISRVAALQKKDPIGYLRKNDSKRLAAIFKLALEVIPQDPTRVDYRQGSTLGDAYKHWFRAKFLQQYRLFFRYHIESHILVYAWVNDEDTKRAYGSGVGALDSQQMIRLISSTRAIDARRPQARYHVRTAVR